MAQAPSDRSWRLRPGSAYHSGVVSTMIEDVGSKWTRTLMEEGGPGIMATRETSERIEQALQDAVSTDRLMQDTRTIAQWVRLSGSDEERRAFDYVEEQCRAAGATVNRYNPECYISWPGPASLEIVAPERRSVECITHSFAAPTNGLEGEV